MSIFSVVGDKYAECKEKIVAGVRWAESEMKGKTGAEKRAAVVSKIDDWIVLPFWLEFLDGPVIGFLIDKICNALNILTDHADWGDIKATDAEIAAVSELPEAEIKTFAENHKAESVNDRFTELCAKYGISGEAPAAPTETPDDHIKANFRRSEFACKCGCGFDGIDPALAEICQTIRDAIGEPITINSGCRCAAHNRKVGGVPNSYHTQGLAADLSCSRGAGDLFAAIRNLYDAGKLLRLGFCQYYRKKNFVHIDCGKKRNNVFSVVE